MTRPLILLILSGVSASVAGTTATANARAISHIPGGHFEASAGADADGRFTYTLKAAGKSIIQPSPIGLDLGEAGHLPGPAWTIGPGVSRKVDDTWKPLWGKRSTVPDRYRETNWQLTGNNSAPFDRARITLRTYDDGIAFRIEIPADAKGSTLEGSGDLAEFRFTGDFTTWGYNGENHNNGPEKLSAIAKTREPVVVLQTADDCFLAIHEADLRGGEPMRLAKGGPTILRAIANPGKVGPGYIGPWRVVFCTRTPGAMVDSHLLELLNPPPKNDFSWVKPGVAVWDWRIDGAKTDGFTYRMDYPSWIRMVDFAAENGIPHLVLDANWYGPEFAKESDPVSGDKATDVRNLINYARAKHVGVWLYLNDVAGRSFPLEKTLAQYGRWGAAGVKYGFMSGTPMEKNRMTRLITEWCATHKLLVNFHDKPVHPFGQMRTWPNAVTREFCQAQLDARTVFQPKTFVTSVFVNMIAGPIDMNNGMFDLRQGRTTRSDNSMEVPSTLVAEAARTLITFSGATIIPDIPEFYRKHPDLLRFISEQKQPWRESITLSGTIGEHIIMARQSSAGKWLVGAATNEAVRQLDIPLGFLPPGNHQATIVQDGPDAHYLHNRETERTSKATVNNTGSIRVELASGGGACILIEPSTRQ